MMKDDRLHNWFFLHRYTERRLTFCRVLAYAIIVFCFVSMTGCNVPSSWMSTPQGTYVQEAPADPALPESLAFADDYVTLNVMGFTRQYTYNRLLNIVRFDLDNDKSAQIEIVNSKLLNFEYEKKRHRYIAQTNESPAPRPSTGNSTKNPLTVGRYVIITRQENAFSPDFIEIGEDKIVLGMGSFSRAYGVENIGKTARIQLDDGTAEISQSSSVEIAWQYKGNTTRYQTGTRQDSTPQNPVRQDPGSGELKTLAARGDRQAIRNWANTKTVSVLNAEVAGLTLAEKAQLANSVLQSNAQGEQRTQLLQIMTTILSRRELGFYAEIWSYTDIFLDGNGFYYNGAVHLEPNAFFGMGFPQQRDTVLHECFHSFNQENGGPPDALNEGSAIWVFKLSFPEGRGLEDWDWAEATFGTKSWYRDNEGKPNYLLEAPKNPSNKLLEVYDWLAAKDPSRLPWRSTEKLQAIYNRFYAGISRKSPNWLTEVQGARNRMLQDPAMR